MKIATVYLHAGPVTATGASPATRVTALSAALAAAGHEVALAAPQDVLAAQPAGSDAARVRAVDVPFAGTAAEDDVLRELPAAAGHLARAWAADPPDVVHALGWLAGLAAVTATQGDATPVVLSLPSLAAAPTPGPASRRARLERALTRSVTHLVASSGAQRDTLVRLGAHRSSVSVVPWGVDAGLFTPDGPAAPRAARPRLLHSGALRAEDGVDDLLAALRLVPDAELVLVGPPSADGDGQLDRVRGLASELHVADRVQLAGPVPRTEVPALVRSADLVASVPRGTPFGTAALEAMACGVPVVATATGGLVEIVVDGATGVLVPPRDVDALAYALRDLLRDPVRREGFGVAATDRARARYAWDRVAGDMAAAYRRVVAPAVEEEPAEPDDADELAVEYGGQALGATNG